MPRLVLNNAYVLFASNDISEFVTQIELKTSVDIIDTTRIGSQSRTRQAGVFDNSVSFQFNQDFADNALEELVNGTSMATTTVGTTVQMQVRPVNAAVSASNPKYTFNAVITEWQSVSGELGALSTGAVSWPISGNITKSITP
jgi:hypothetical protein